MALSNEKTYWKSNKLIKQETIFSHIKPFRAFVINDPNLVTGQHPTSVASVAIQMIKSIEIRASE